jgi:hypothetical protein
MAGPIGWLSKHALGKGMSGILSSGLEVGRGIVGGALGRPAGGGGLRYGLGRLVGGTGRLGAQGIYKGITSETARGAVADIGRAAIMRDPSAPAGVKLNPILEGAIDWGITAAVVLGTAGAATAANAEMSTPGAKMQSLSYGGSSLGSFKDNLGADGNLALALHKNRHG